MFHTKVANDFSRYAVLKIRMHTFCSLFSMCFFLIVKASHEFRHWRANIDAIKINWWLIYFGSTQISPRNKHTGREPRRRLHSTMLIYGVCSLSEYKSISIHTQLNARGKINKESDRGWLIYTRASRSVCSGENERGGSRYTAMMRLQGDISLIDLCSEGKVLCLQEK